MPNFALSATLDRWKLAYSRLSFNSKHILTHRRYNPDIDDKCVCESPSLTDGKITLSHTSVRTGQKNKAEARHDLLGKTGTFRPVDTQDCCRDFILSLFSQGRHLLIPSLFMGDSGMSRNANTRRSGSEAEALARQNNNIIHVRMRPKRKNHDFFFSRQSINLLHSHEQSANFLNENLFLG